VTLDSNMQVTKLLLG
jgi:hypothetical protein